METMASVSLPYRVLEVASILDTTYSALNCSFGCRVGTMLKCALLTRELRLWRRFVVSVGNRRI